MERLYAAVAKLPAPYFDDGGGRLVYCGDCRTLLPLLEPGSVDLVLTDPPYGMNLNTDYGGFNGWSGKGISWPKVHGDNEPFDPSPWIAFPKVILWGANFFASRLPDNGAWLVFNKRGDGRPSEICFGDCELAWTNIQKQSVRMFSKIWHGVSRWSSEGVLHPTQKPVALMNWCIQQAGDAEIILDPFGGSGTTARAAKDLGRQCILFEIEERYCEIASNRLRQEVLF